MGSRPESIPDSIAEVLVDPKAHANDQIHEAFKWLRANNPLGYAEPSSTDPFWIVSRQLDIKAIAKRNDVFHSGDRNVALIDRIQDRHFREIAEGRPSLLRTLVQMDLPDHPKYREVAVSFFRPTNLAHLENAIRTIARESIDHLAELGGECDFAKDIAFVYPLRVIMSVIGVPKEDQPRMLKLSHEFFGTTDPDQARNAQENTGIAAAELTFAVVNEYNHYFDQLLVDRRNNPRDDLASIIANAKIDGVPMPQLESRSYCIVAATAGHDTTSAASAGGVWALCENPDEFAKVAANPGHMMGLVEESIRWTAPAKVTMRSATEDVEICGRKFLKDDWVALGWVSGNRDEEVIAEPFAFKVDRDRALHTSFGWGPHNCIGQHLARIEMRILFEELFRRVKFVELAGVPATLASLTVSGPKTVPIRYQMK